MHISCTLPSLILLVAMVSPAISFAQQTISKQALKELESRLERSFKGKVLTLRNFQKGGFLRYTRSGSLIQTLDPGTWTLYSMLEIKDIAIKQDYLEFRGNRRAVLFNPKQGRLEQHRTGVPFKAMIEFGPQGPDLAEIETAMKAIFLTSSERLADFVPNHWKKFLQSRPQKGAPLPEGEAAVDDERYSTIPDLYRVKDGVTAPKLATKVDPSYTEEARLAGLNGTVILAIVVMHDGTAGHIELTQPLGLGMDEEAMAAVSQWRFKPGMKDGKPVNVQATVEVSFTMLPGAR